MTQVIPGSIFGSYRVIERIGAGGMGEVYRAHDPKLGRDVALKVLPRGLADDPNRIARLEREARLLAALNHPHVATIHGIEEDDGRQAIVLELIEGTTLAERLQKGRLPVHQALQYASQIADALDAAHRRGIVHRDLKPSNVMVTKSGVKLLDFGIAKIAASAPAGAGGTATGTSGTLTLDGTLLGTLHYMAPEQLEGREADARCDLFAFGAVMYEMLTGRRAFPGETQSSVIAAVLDSEPAPVSASQPLTPFPLDEIVGRCLAKDPDERWQTAADLKRGLLWIAASSGENWPPARGHSSSRSILWRAAIGIALVAVLSGLAVWSLRSQSAPQITRTIIDIAPADALRSLPGDTGAGDGRPSRTAMAISPDGRTLVFSATSGGQQQLYLRPVDELEATPIAGTEDGLNPFFSPDGAWIGFWARRGPSVRMGTLKKVPVAGGSPVPICDTEAPVFGASWGTADTIVFALDIGELRQVPASGGTPQSCAPRSLTAVDTKNGEVSHRLPHFLPDGVSVLFTVSRRTVTGFFGTGDDDDGQIAVYSPGTDRHTPLLQGGADARYSSTGHILYVRGGVLMAAPFDAHRREVTGGSVALISDLMQAANLVGSEFDTGAGQFSTSSTGSLVYARAGTSPDALSSLIWVSRAGVVERIPVPAGPYYGARLAPDDQRFVVLIGHHLWVYDIPRAIFTPLTSGTDSSSFPVWAGRDRIVFADNSAGPDGLFTVPADGSQRPEPLVRSDTHILTPVSWSQDGDLAFIQNHVDGRGSNDIWILPSDKSQPARSVVASAYHDISPAFSPDGRWLAYVTEESQGSITRQEVYVRPYPGPGKVTKISSNGGVGPLWSRDGRELFYRHLSRPGWTTVMVVPVTYLPDLRAAPRVLFEVEIRTRGYAPSRGWDVTAGGRFLMVQREAPLTMVPRQLVLVQNWHEELKRRVPVN